MDDEMNKMPQQLDLVAGTSPVQIEIKSDGSVLWVHMFGVSVLRICRIKDIEIIDNRNIEVESNEPRKCVICGTQLNPFQHDDGSYVEMTSHEFQCFKKNPSKVPARLRNIFEKTLLWERRSKIAKQRKVNKRIK